ncbi:MAG: hypothetical protein D6730_16600 [Bacteroidetes bacterium]|nr:MAG: hypothetical protein D6730_16600 [Bacteroidota bacterium]
MKDRYYSLPVPFGRLLNKQPLPTVRLETSVKQHILLILMTHFDEYRYDPTYGCSIWEQDFEMLPKVNTWKDELKRSIEDSLQTHEPRLDRIKVTVKIAEQPFTHPEDRKVRRIKKRISIDIQAKLRETDEPFQHQETLFLSPISLD